MLKHRRTAAGVGILLLLVMTGWKTLAQETNDPGAAEPAAEPASYQAGLWTMKVTDAAVWFEPPEMILGHPDTEFDVLVRFCRALQPKSGTHQDGTPWTYDEPYGDVPKEEGEQLAQTVFSGRLTAYPWTSAGEAEDVAVPRTVLERSFLRLVIRQLEARNDEVSDQDWADPKNRLGVSMHASGFVEILEGEQIFKMVDTQFFIFPRKGKLTILCEDDYYTWTLRGDQSEQWPRDQDRPSSEDPTNPAVGSE